MKFTQEQHSVTALCGNGTRIGMEDSHVRALEQGKLAAASSVRLSDDRFLTLILLAPPFFSTVPQYED